MRNIRVVSAKVCDISKDGMAAHCTFEIEVLPQFCNRMGNMHGGCVALLADMSTTLATAPVSQKGFWEFGGVSRTLSITYLQPVRRGATVLVECMLRSIGKRLCEYQAHYLLGLLSAYREAATTQCLIKDKANGKLLAMAEHGKSALSEQDLSKSLL
jgi:acyl-coenzyme A thioesterase 13